MKCRACSKALTPFQIRKGFKSCSRSCGAKRFRVWPKRVCRVCPRRLTNDQVRRGNVTCGFECAGLLQRARPAAWRRDQARKGNAARAEKNAKRLIQAIATECKPLLARTGDRELMKEFVKVVVKHRRIGYQRGWSAHYMRRRRSGSAA